MLFALLLLCNTLTHFVIVALISGNEATTAKHGRAASTDCLLIVHL